MKIGKAKEGGLFKFFKMEDGDNVYRILPPLGELSEKGIWSRYCPLVWGYKNTEGQTMPFIDPSVKNRSNGMWEHLSAAQDRRIKLEAQKEKMKEAGASKEQMEKINEVLKQYNIEKKNYVLAVNLKGEVGVLKLGVTCHKALVGDKQTDDPGLFAKAKTNNPVKSLTGVYINFYRSGRGFNTSYTVSFYQEEQDDGSFRNKLHTIDDNFIKILDEIGSDRLNLNKLYPTPTLEEVARIVEEGPVAVDEILGSRGSSASSTTTEAKTEVAETTEVTEEKVEAKAETAPVVEEKVETKTTVAAEAEAPVVEEKKETVNANDLDPDEFLKSMGVDVSNG